MDNDLFTSKLNKYIPVIVVIATILLGGFLLIRKGIISIPTVKKKGEVILKKTSVIDLFFTDKEYKLSYSGMDPSQLIDIAKYDKTEQWQGTGNIEEDVVFGGNVMSMSDRDRQKSSAILLKNLNLAPIDNIKFAVNLKSDPENIESVNILFGDKNNTSYFRFPVTKLVYGLNYFNIPKYRFFLVEETKEEIKQTSTKSATKVAFSWDNIERIQLELISRPNSKVSTDISWIRGEKQDSFVSEWKWDNSTHFLNYFHTADGKLALMVYPSGLGLGILRKVASVKDFEYSVKITSFKEGYIGIFFRGDYRTGYGYYFTVAGIRTSDWYLTKKYPDNNIPKVENLLEGKIANFEFSRDQPFWLKAIAKGTNIAIYFSLDNKNYTKIGEIIDKQFSTGAIGISTAGGAAIFDDFYLSLK